MPAFRLDDPSKFNTKRPTPTSQSKPCWFRHVKQAGSFFCGRIAKYLSFNLIALLACPPLSLGSESASDAVRQALNRPPDRPNILWITVEDMSPTLGCWGDSYAKTPNIDQFALESVRYTNAFATSPVCSPSRSCLITGVYATSLGTQDLRSAFPLPDLIHAWPRTLRKSGYFTSNNFKTDYNTSDEPRLIEEAWERNGRQAHWRQRRKDQPFFCVFNEMVTHQSRTGVWSNQAFVQHVQSRLGEQEIHDPQSAILPPYYPDTEVVREGMARFYDCVTVMDQNFGKLIKQLKADGLYDQTIIFFFSDHGSGLPRGKRLLHDSGLRVPLIIRFPKKFQHLAPAAGGTTLDRMVSFVDFPPTVLNLLGHEIPDTMQGQPFLGPESDREREFVFGARDRVDEAYDKARSVRDKRFLYIRNYRPQYSYNQPSLYSDFSLVRQQITLLARQQRLNEIQMTYARQRRAAEELYDTLEDPHNVRNLVDEPRFREVVQRMRETHLDWVRQTKDLGFYPEEEVWNALVESATPYEFARQQATFPVDEVLEAASLIGESSAMSRQIELSADADRVVKFQAVMGLRAQIDLSDQAFIALRRCIQSGSSAVRTEAAAELVKRGFAEYLPTLVNELESGDENRVLRASRAIQLLRNQATPVVPQMESVLARWRSQTDTPIPLFIRFSLEAALDDLGRPLADRFSPDPPR
jgi:N-sulfoglucosamine sulfohydrolase